MKRIYSFFLVVALACGQAWAQTEIASYDFTSWTTQNVAAGGTVDGIYFKSATTITNGSGILFSSGATTSSNFIAIPLEDINGAVTITVTFPSARPQWKNYFQGLDAAPTASDLSANPSSMSGQNTRPDNNTTTSSWTINTDKTYGVFYIGAGSNNNAKTIESITITTPCTAPTSVDVTGTWHAFPGEPITLTATATGGKGTVSYQWYHGSTDESNKIAGATEATYTKQSCTYDDAGSYYCKASTGDGDGCTTTSDAFQVKMLRVYVNVGRGGDPYGYIDLDDTDPANNKASGMIFLGEKWNYAFSVADGCGNYYGQNNDPTYGAMNKDNSTGWTMNSNQQCCIYSWNGAHYTFIVDYTNMGAPVVSVVYPPDNQAADHVIYFDNSVLNWSNIHYRVGREDYTSKYPMTLVNGTANLYQHITAEWNNLRAWHIADNCGWSDYNTIYLTNTGDDYAIENSINYEGGAVTQDVTITPSTSHSTGGDAINSNCEFYSYSMEQGMKTQNVAIDAPEHGTVTVSYIDVNGNPQSFTSGDRDLAHTCILTITATPECGYRLASLQVNGTDITNGDTHILTETTTITAIFEDETYTVTLNTNEGTIQSGEVTSYTHGTAVELPTDITKAHKEFDGWYDNPSFAGSPVTEIAATECGNKAYWAKWIDEIQRVTYIMGACYIKNGMWTPNSNDGSVSAWLFLPGATVEDNNLKSTTDISYSSNSKGGIYFHSKDVSQMDNASLWNTSSNSTKTITALSVGSGSTLKFNLGSMQADKITYYVFPNSNDAYSIDLTVNGTKTTYPIASGKQYQWHKYPYKGSTYSGEFSIKSVGKGSRVVAVVEVPLVTITYDANGGTGTMSAMQVAKGATAELDDNLFTWADHKFVGWTEDPSGTGTLISDGADYATLTNVTLYAQWEEIIHTTITLDASGAFNNYTHSVIATYNEPMPELLTLPQRVGYVFDGYYSEPNGAGTKYYTGLGDGTRNWDQTVPAATLYANWVTPCDLTPTLTNTTPIVTIWDGQKVDEGIVRLTCDFDTTGVQYALQSVTPANAINGCHFEYFDEHIHLMGTPAVGNTTTQTVNVTFTIANSCTPSSTYTISQTIRIYPASQKPKVAFILTGTKGGSFDAYTAADKTACDNLLTYLGNFYDITCVNGYATKNTDQIAAYYADYDLLVVTDFLNTGEGYTNAIGTLIDKKPILSFEAYVANQSNWHIGSNPKDPKPKVQDMKVLCAGHAIFADDEYMGTPVDVVSNTDTTVHVLDALSSEADAKGLQGFTINEAPDFIFLATIRDANNNRDLIVCCERQVVFPARLLLYGINFYEMGNLSPAGKIIMKQMMDYLLMTDETKVADCSLVFDNHDGDKLWSNPKNWAPGYNIIPTPYHGTRIIAECHVDYDEAHAGSVKINKGRDEHNNVVDGKLIIEPTGGLTVAGVVTKVNDTRYASPTMIKAEDLLIKADENHNGAFVYGNKESDVRATVQYYSRGEGAMTASPVWQYMGIPFQPGHTAIDMYRAAWMCRWTTASDQAMGGLWQWVENEDVLVPFEGYCITQEDKKTYTFAGKLNAPLTRTIPLDHQDADGFAFAANSWTAPIKIQEMQDADFINTEKSIYIYHTGSYANWTNYGSPAQDATLAAATLPGQYAVIPIHSSPYMAGADSVIPAMQGFFVQATAADAKLKLVYNRVVYDAKYFKTSTQPMRAPRRGDDPEVMLLTVSGESYGGDRVYILSRGDFSEDYEDGWDGRKIDGDMAAPKLAVVKQAGDMAVAALPTKDERYLSFRAGQDSLYTFTFDYDGERIYLYDQLTEEATEIRTGNTYAFSAHNGMAINRFLITRNPPQRTPDDIEVVETPDGLLVENFGQGQVAVRIVDMQGRVLYALSSTDALLEIRPTLPAGVYLAHVTAGSKKYVVKLIGGEASR